MSNFAMLRDELLAEIETIAPVVREYASQSEQLGRLAEPIIKAVRQTSLLRFICAHELGGCEADPLTVMEVAEAMSRIDGSVGWTLGIIANATAFAGAFLPAASARRAQVLRVVRSTISRTPGSATTSGIPTRDCRTARRSITGCSRRPRRSAAVHSQV